MFNKLPRVFALALTTLLLCATVGQAQVTLRYKFKEGETLTFQGANKIKMSNQIEKMQIDVNLTQDMTMVWNVVSVANDGSAKIKIKMTRMKMTMEMPPPLGNAIIDSDDDKEPENPLAKQMAVSLRKIVGQEITMSMSSRGEVSDLKYPPELEKELKQLSGGGLGGTGVDSLFGSSPMLLPAEPVKQGDSWTQKTETKMALFTIGVDMKYTYDGPTVVGGQTLEKVLVRPSMSLKSDKAGFSMKTDEEKSKGVTLFDNTAGRIVELQNDQIMTMAIEQGGLRINMNMEANTNLRLKEAK